MINFKNGQYTIVWIWIPRKEVLEYFDVPIDGEFIELTDGGNSCIANPNTQFKEFLGCSINGIAEAVAKKINKPTKWN